MEAATVLKIISKSGAFYTFGDQKFQGKEKLSHMIGTDEKIKKSLETQIQGKIKEMRLGKKVLDDDALVNLTTPTNEVAVTEEDSAE